MVPHRAARLGHRPSVGVAVSALDLDALIARADARLSGADRALRRDYPGDRGRRQPIHTVYVPADRFESGLTRAWGRAATAALGQYAATPEALAAATGMPDAVVAQVHERMRAKLLTEPIEDLRIDFEDGYGNRPSEQEDADVEAAAAALANSLDEGTSPPFGGIRMKSLEAPTRARGLRTLVRFVERLAEREALGENFVVTLPKVTSVDQVSVLVDACGSLEDGLGLPAGLLRFEIQVETPQSILGPDGTVLVAPMLHAAAGRCTGLHYGTYDYSASCGIAAAYQSMAHPAADHAKSVMQVAAAGTGVAVSDGSTNVLPIGSPEQVHEAWRLHAALVRRSLERGFYQGWDLHPAQLPTRFLATYAFFRDGLDSVTARLRAYVGSDASVGYLDEPATAAALAGFLVRGIECGAVSIEEAQRATGLERAGLWKLARRA